ncbi:NAD(P)/FAD-dependent oxidoreductase [Pseudomonas graminis]|uniref:FAD/NAD(P)-dependent oxidoreductase n=1 Tax=Pseudomonas graminis TaxID=158627 RepID=UPI00234B45EF|nr:NAD(P)/FAD-dependent oxidoreductase [Pseudomonas graminis]MDC6378880.1 NAD(P)/FAD-dependent oxidoreductase [Pseudomonas graminis]
MSDHVQVIILGAGPAGIAAALHLHAKGVSVRVLDEQATPGGQIYREVSLASEKRKSLLGKDYAAGSNTVARFLDSGIDYVPNASVWLLNAEREVHYRVAGKSYMATADRVLLCSGAYERPMPVPGWTLPGVMTAGAGQILLKTGGRIPNGAVVLAGTGPLLYLLATQYLQAGVKIKALVDTSTRPDLWASLRYLPAAIPAWRQLWKGIGLMAGVRRAGIDWYQGVTNIRIEGESQAKAINFSHNGSKHQIACDLVLLHQGVIPNTHPTLSISATHCWDEGQVCWVADQDRWGELSVPGFFIAGDGAGVNGAEAAALQGRLAGIGIAMSLKVVCEKDAEAEAQPVRSEWNKYRRIRPLLERLYRPTTDLQLPADDTIICRCEEVTAGAVRQYAALGCLGPNQTKAFGRCGMGPCQGRQCGLAVTQILAASRQVSPGEVGYYRIRPPLKPITLLELATEK